LRLIQTYVCLKPALYSRSLYRLCLSVVVSIYSFVICNDNTFSSFCQCFFFFFIDKCYILC
jgi:hypothetical protein